MIELAAHGHDHESEQRVYRLPDGTLWFCIRTQWGTSWGMYQGEIVSDARNPGLYQHEGSEQLCGRYFADKTEAQCFWDLLCETPEAAWMSQVL